MTNETALADHLRTTCGPWEFGTHESPNGGETHGYYVIDERGFEFFYVDADDDPRTEARARLIAAAPELLAALEIFVVTKSGDEFTTITVRSSAIDAARAAIAKASGA